MRIVQSCGSKSWGGLEMQTLKIAQGLKNKGEDVLIWCARDSELEKQAKKNQLHSEPVFTGEKDFFSNITSMKESMNTRNVDIIHTHLSHDLWSIVPAVQFAESQAPIFLTKRMASDVKKKDVFHRYLYSHVHQIYAISNYIRKSVLRTCPVREDKVALLWNAIDLPAYRPERVNRKEVRNAFSLNQSDIIVGMCGRFTPGKGHPEFIRAAKILKNTINKRIIFLVVGGASFGEQAYYCRIKHFAEQLLTKEDIVFAGFQEDMGSMMSAMDILAFPSHAESFGNILLEAMAMELPIVASSSGGVPDIILPEETGLLVPPKDADALAKGIARLVEDEGLRERLTLGAKQRVRERFNFQDYIERLLSDYRASLPGRAMRETA